MKHSNCLLQTPLQELTKPWLLCLRAEELEPKTIFVQGGHLAEVSLLIWCSLMGDACVARTGGSIVYNKGPRLVEGWFWLIHLGFAIKETYFLPELSDVAAQQDLKPRLCHGYTAFPALSLMSSAAFIIHLQPPAQQGHTNRAWFLFRSGMRGCFLWVLTAKDTFSPMKPTFTTKIVTSANHCSLLIVCQALALILYTNCFFTPLYEVWVLLLFPCYR